LVTAFFASEPAMASTSPWGGSVRPVVRRSPDLVWALVECVRVR